MTVIYLSIGYIAIGLGNGMLNSDVWIIKEVSG
jgi:hypothetical protein